MPVLWTLSELVAAVASQIAALPAPRNGQVRAIPDERTIRYCATLGLLDRPAMMRGRTALYGSRHPAQVVAIKRLQAMGRSLAEIQQLWPTLDDATLVRMSGVELPAAGNAGGLGTEHRACDHAPAIWGRLHRWTRKPAGRIDRRAAPSPSVRGSDMPAGTRQASRHGGPIHEDELDVNIVVAGERDADEDTSAAAPAPRTPDAGLVDTVRRWLAPKGRRHRRRPPRW